MKKMCLHDTIDIIPTTETVWELDDKYIVKCSTCGKYIFKSITSEDLIHYINLNKCIISTGEKYLLL